MKIKDFIKNNKYGIYFLLTWILSTILMVNAIIDRYYYLQLVGFASSIFSALGLQISGNKK